MVFNSVLKNKGECKWCQKGECWSHGQGGKGKSQGKSFGKGGGGGNLDAKDVLIAQLQAKLGMQQGMGMQGMGMGMGMQGMGLQQGMGMQRMGMQGGGSGGARGSYECGDFKNGNCTRGDACRFSHSGGGMGMGMGMQGGGGGGRGAVECGDFRNGSCMRGDSCRFSHGDAGGGMVFSSKAGKGGGGGKGGKSLLRTAPSDQKVWIGGLRDLGTFDTERNKLLCEHMKQGGQMCIFAEIKKNGMGGAVFQTADEAALAIAMLNGSIFDGATLEVDVWTEKAQTR